MPTANNDQLVHPSISLHLLDIEGLTHLPLDKRTGHFADHIFRCIFVNAKSCSFIEISLMFIPTGQIDSNPALV